MLVGQLAGLVAGRLVGWLVGWLAGWRAGCGHADLRVKNGHEHFDLHVFPGSQDVPRAGWLAGWQAGKTPNVIVS